MLRQSDLFVQEIYKGNNSVGRRQMNLELFLLLFLFCLSKEV